MRASPSQKRIYQEVHSDDITEVSPPSNPERTELQAPTNNIKLKFHPRDPNILLSGSTDGLVNLCDTRIEDEDDVVIQTFNHGASIHHAGFLSDADVFALSHDERFAAYSGDEERDGVATRDFGDVRDGLGCQYVANVSTKVDGSGGILGVGSQE